MRSACAARAVALSFVLTLLPFHGCRSRSNADEFVHARAPLVALRHVRVIDGTGARAKADQTLVIENGHVRQVGDAADTPAPPGALVLDLPGHTVIPGLVGMHDHLFYAVNKGAAYVATGEAFARLYLACGVTTIRTAGALDLEADLKTKRAIDEGREPGPRVYVTSPYLNGYGAQADPARARRDVETWAEQGATSFKAYTDLKRSELEAVVGAAHNRGLKVTGHLCAVGFREAAALGIDNLEHGLLVDTEFSARRTPDTCPGMAKNAAELVALDADGAPVRQLIKELVNRRVAVTSTLSVFESLAAHRFTLDPRMAAVMTPESYAECVAERARRAGADGRAGSEMWAALLKKEMRFERSFVEAGGLLLAGADPTGWGGVLAGFGDQRNVELLVEAGFTPEEAVRVASANGAEFLGEAQRLGTLTVGKRADVVVLRGDLSADVGAIRNVVLVFKDGVGYDPAKLLASVRVPPAASDTRRPRIIAGLMLAAVSLVLLFLLLLRRRRATLSRRRLTGS